MYCASICQGRAADDSGKYHRDDHLLAPDLAGGCRNICLGFRASISGSDQQISAYPARILSNTVSASLPMQWIEGIHCIVAVIWATSREMTAAMVEVGEEGWRTANRVDTTRYLANDRQQAKRVFL